MKHLEFNSTLTLVLIFLTGSMLVINLFWAAKAEPEVKPKNLTKEIVCDSISVVDNKIVLHYHE